MSTHLRTLILGLVAALLLLQPAARAGAGCAETMLTGSCACTESAGSEDEPSSCCGGAQDDSEEGSPEDGGPHFGTESGCACTASPLPDPAGTPKTSEAHAGSLVERLVFATSCALTQRAGVIAAPEAPPLRPPRRARPTSLPRGSIARTLAYLGTWLR